MVVDGAVPPKPHAFARLRQCGQAQVSQNRREIRSAFQAGGQPGWLGFDPPKQGRLPAAADWIVLFVKLALPFWI